VWYALLGRVVWSIGKRVIRRRLGLAGRRPRLPLVAGVALAAAGAAFARARRRSRS